MSDNTSRNGRRQVGADAKSSTTPHTNPQGGGALGLRFRTIPEGGYSDELLHGRVPVLVRNPDLSVVKPGEGVDDVLIEGDNLPALTALKSTLPAGVDVIYIDPPYNTGSAFVYHDHLVDAHDPFRHSKWLSFMRARLEIARDLLADDGAIYVSIDSHEHPYLEVLMDSIFGEDNFVADIIVRTVTGGRNSNHLIGADNEYVLAYARDKSRLQLKGEPVDESAYKLRDEHFAERGGYRLNKNDTGTLSYSPSMDFVFEHDGVRYAPNNSTDEEIEARHANKAPRKDWTWRWSRPKLEWGIANDFVVFKRGHIYTKEYARVDFRNRPIGRTRGLSNLFLGTEYSTRQGGDDAQAVIGKRVFSYPKPVALIRELVRMTTADRPDATVLDFFAGSGTTGQAVAELNAADGGRRRSILITTNFEDDGVANGIARDITAVRMRRVLTGRDWNDGKPRDPMRGSLFYYRLEMRDVPADDEDMWRAFPKAEDYEGLAAMATGTHRPMTESDLGTDAPRILADAVGSNRVSVLSDGLEHGRRTLLVPDRSYTMDPGFFDLVDAFREWAGDGAEIYVNTPEPMDDEARTYPASYVNGVRSTVESLRRRDVLRDSTTGDDDSDDSEL